MWKSLLLLAAVLHAGYGAGDTCTTTQGDAECDCSCTCEAASCVLPCTAGVEGPNTLTTFDGATYTMETNNKYVVSRWQETSDNQCKFQVRIDTEDAADGSPQVGWLGAAFGVHAKNSDKFERNFRLSLKQGIVEIRGRGYKPTEVSDSGCFQSDTGDEAWSFCVNIDTPGKFVVSGEVPALGCWYEVTYVEGADGGNDQVWIDAAPFYDGELFGMCGNRDGDSSNDDQFCPRNSGNVSADCIDGDHQNNG